MKYAQIIRRVQRVLRRESPYRHADADLVAIIDAVLARAPHLRRGRVVRRTVEAAMRGER